MEPATECHLTVEKGQQGHVSARMQGRHGVPSEASWRRKTHTARVYVHGRQQQAGLTCGDGHQPAAGEKGVDWRGDRKLFGVMQMSYILFWMVATQVYTMSTAR